MTGSSPIISLRGVDLALRARRRLFSSAHKILTGLDLDLYPQQTLGLIGRNGCGKTTLLRVIAGVLAPDAGRVTRRTDSCHLLTLNPWLVPHLTGRQNALLACMLNGRTQRQARLLLPQIESIAEIGSYFDEPVSSYSAGMLLRLGFAAAVQVEPDVLLLDELLGVGDAEFYDKSRRILHGMIEGDRTVVLVSHNDQALRELCDRIVWLDGGRIRADGDPVTVLAQYHEATGTAMPD
jgi:lipopolysaccharide transport system ATP-binding protein